MTEQETVLLIETEQRCKSNTHRIDKLEGELKEIQSEQKAIYKSLLPLSSLHSVSVISRTRWMTPIVR